MGVRKDLKQAKRRTDLAARHRIELIRDEKTGTVREARAVPIVATPTTGSTADLPYTNAAEAPDAVILRRRTDDGTWRPITAAAFAAEVTATAKGLIVAGLEPGGRVAVMSRTRYEWTVLDFAIWAAGGQTVPVYATSSAAQVDWIVRDSGPAWSSRRRRTTQPPSSPERPPTPNPRASSPWTRTRWPN